MDGYESFSSYELTHDNNGSNNTGSGCLDGCFTIIAISVGFIAVVVGVISMLI